MRRRGGIVRGLVFAVVAGAVACVTSFVACGGTTGREGLAAPDTGAGDATVEGGGDDGTFDVAIQYIDRQLPDVYTGSHEASLGGEGGLPNCPPDIPAQCSVNDPLGVCLPNAPDAAITLVLDGGGVPNFEIPAVSQGDADVPAPDGSACATQVWLGSQCDLCLKLASGGDPSAPWVGQYGHAMLPPCSDLVGAGVAVAGPGAARPRYDLCMELFTCMMSTKCFVQLRDEAGALTGDPPCVCTSGDDSQCSKNGGPGLCLNEVMAALELSGKPQDRWTDIGKNYSNCGSVAPDQPGHGGGCLGYMFSVLNSNCAEACAVTDAGQD